MVHAGKAKITADMKNQQTAHPKGLSLKKLR
jgi:hypothetical protein